ncbi:MAG: hypothetical protein CL565_02110 [Alphaproteobacteria bacterium]|nr:hypothetical protein [Alphaproteobacteria bacterium]
MSIFPTKESLITKEATEVFGSEPEATRFLNTPQPAYLGNETTTPLSLALSSKNGYNTVRNMMQQLTCLDR